MQIKQWFQAIYDQLFNQPADPDAELISRLTRILTREINAIDDLFIKYEVDARIDRADVAVSDTGGFVRYKVINSAKVSKLTSLEDDISQIVSELRNDDVRVKIRKPRLIIELPYPFEPKTLEWADAPTARLRPFQALAGMDYTTINVSPVIVDWTDKSTSNVLVSGETGSGKTNGLLEVILSLAYSTSPADAHIAIIDPKFSPAINALRGLPHVAIYNEPDDCARAIAAIKAEVNRRKRRPDKRKVFLVVEELSELRIEAGSDKADLFEQMKSIAQIGREQGIHVIACTQKAVVEVVDTVLRANLPIRLAFKVGTSKESEVATGLTDVDCVRLPGRGAGYFVRNGRAQRVQTHFIDDEQIFDFVDEIAAKHAGSDTYRILMTTEVNASSESLPALVTRDHVDIILDAFSLGDLFADDGSPVRGAKAKVIRLIHGEDATRGGANDQWANNILSYIWRTENA